MDANLHCTPQHAGSHSLLRPDQADGLLERLLDAVLAEQRCDWIAGKRIPADETLRQHPELAGEPACAAELIYHEFSLRQEQGELPDWQQHTRQYPEHAALLERLRQADRLVEQTFATPAQLPTGTFADYDLLEEAGRGGMGIVFKARHKNLDRIVALKVLRSDGTGEERKRFDREARAVARLQHPNIVQVYEVGETAGRAFVSLEFVDGQSLAHRLHGTPLPARRAAALVKVLARAMHYAHERGVIHRDLKPANVLLAGTAETPIEDCIAKVADFGLAKKLDAQGDTHSGAVLGTPSYMAPEQAEARSATVDRRTDVYGLGAILYELLTGRPPFRADSAVQTLRQVVDAEPVRPRLLNPSVPRDLETVCLKCLEKEPSRRYATALALADDLKRFENSRPVLARPIGALARGWRWCRRNPIPAGLTALLALVLIGGLSGILYQWQQADAARREAVAKAAEARQVLSELIQSSQVTPLIDDFPQPPSIEPLLKAAEHCRELLENNPEDTELRIALTNVYGRLGNALL
jgi:tRNA A-37 threonylcarbamoyl transferase component Bud32